MIKYFISENIKIKHTFANKLIFIAPVMLALLSGLLTADYFQVDIYNWWYAIILPGVLSIECCLLARIDGNKKNKAVLSLPVDLKKVWIAKIIIGVKNILISCMIIFIVAQLSIYIIPINSISNVHLINGFIAFLVIVVTSMWQVPLYFFIGKKIGLFPTIIFSMAAGMFSTITAVSKLWWINPLSYTSRLMCPILKILPNGLMAVPESQSFVPEVLEISQIPFALAVSISLFILITYVTAKWYEKQEAR